MAVRGAGHVRLELSRRGDYAVRAMLTLASPSAGWLTAAQLAERTAIPVSFVPQVMGDLVRAGFVSTRRGRRGGYAIARDPSEVFLLGSVDAVDRDRRLRSCVLRGGSCGADGTHCAVHDAFDGASRAATDALASVSLAELDL
ncbi:MAG TPA: Rrf2 family transcriptional regulator [Candidatus Limnocylindria bacterium]|nr:Rrf2 family transcriptional regulator [Candidatus Limnocylindria bacterium]